MVQLTDPLIIGAGPTGLATALFLAEHGQRARIIDKAPAISPHSKAFGVNVRSMKLLASTGVTDRFLAHGRRMSRLNLRRGGQVLATLRLNEVDKTYPFMLVQSQADSERMLQEALAERGVQVERGVEARSIDIDGDTAIVTLKSLDGEEAVVTKNAGARRTKAASYRTRVIDVARRCTVYEGATRDRSDGSIRRVAGQVRVVEARHRPQSR